MNFSRHEETVEDFMGPEEDWTKKLIMNAAPSLALLALFAVKFVLLIVCPSFIEQSTKQTFYFPKWDEIIYFKCKFNKKICPLVFVELKFMFSL